jgi:hypothetical protein
VNTDTGPFVASAGAVLDNAARLGLTWRLTPATVLDGTSVMNTLVTMDSDIEAQPARVISLIGTVVINQRVMLLVVPPLGTYIIGGYGDPRSVFIDEITRNSTVGTFTTTETVLDQITFTAKNALRYKLTWVGTIQSSVLNDGLGLRCRWIAGSSLTSSGTLFSTREINANVAGKGQAITIVKTVTGITDGEATIGVLGVRDSGTGNVQSFADATREVSMLLEAYP